MKLKFEPLDEGLDDRRTVNLRVMLNGEAAGHLRWIDVDGGWDADGNPDPDVPDELVAADGGLLGLFAGEHTTAWRTMEDAKRAVIRLVLAATREDLAVLEKMAGEAR